MVLALLSQSLGLGFANPYGEKVISGDVQFSLDGDTLSIIQSSGKAIITWENFGIDSGESTIFFHPDSGASTLNRVTGNDISAIYGTLQANGQIWLINPNGILFGPGSVVDVNGLLASTLDVTDADYLNGGGFTLSGSSTAPIVNRGTINLSDGSTAILAAQRVENHGVIGGIDSRIFLVGSNEVLVSSGLEGTVTVSSGGGANGQVVNTGELSGKEITMETVNNNKWALAIQNSGVVRANSASKEGGKVRLVNTGSAGIQVDGTLDASGDIGGEIEISTLGAINLNGEVMANGLLGSGGEVSVQGESIGLGSSAVLSGSGVTGGTVWLGNGGTTSIQTQSGAQVLANGTAGDGGDVVVTSSGSAILGGLISTSSTDALGGRTQVNAGQVFVLESGEIQAGGGLDGGLIQLGAEEELVTDGALLASGDSGTGGEIILEGNMVSVGGQSVVEANGGSKGGKVYAGGGFGGADEDIRNSQSSYVADGAQIRANATEAGNGGQIVVWSDGDTAAMGSFEAKGAGNIGRGGLIELSGLEDLRIGGKVDTSGLAATGTLLLDPVNITLGSSGIDAASIALALATSNVVVHTAAINQADPGESGTVSILRDFDLVYDSENHFTILAHGDINVGSDGAANELLMVNQGEGNITLVAGWDGTGSASFTSDQIDTGYGEIFASDILAGTYGDYGVGGSIFVNQDNAHRVEIGSAGGETNLFGDSILIQSGDNSDENAQIGFNLSHVASGSVDGDINLYAKGNVLLFARDSVNDGDDRKEVQIGHGGNQPSVNADVSGDITIQANGALVGFAGRRDSYLQIGHGGWGITGNMSGDISVEASIIQLEAGSWDDSWVQVGHGGRDVRGHHSGDISVVATLGNITLEGANADLNGSSNMNRSYAMIGHGGYNSDGFIVAEAADADQYTTIVDDANGDGSLTQEDNVIAQRRDENGNLLFVDPTTGDPTTVDTGVPLLAGHSGDIHVEAAGSINVYAGGGTDTFAQIGHGGRLTAGAHSGDISVIANAGNVIFDRYISSADLDRGTRAYVKIGHGGHESSGGGTGDILVDAAGRIEFHGGRAASFAQIGHGGRDEDNNSDNALADFVQGTHSGNITVVAGDDITFRSGFGSTGSTSFSMIGHGGYESYALANEGHHGEIYVESTGGSIDFYAGQDALRPGQDPNATVPGWGADAEDIATGGLEGNLDISFTMIGHGGDSSRGDHYGSITVIAAEDFRLEATGGYDGVGFINAIANGSTTGQNDDVTLGDPVYNTGNNDSQSGTRNFAQVGHGGYNSEHTESVSGSASVGFGNVRDEDGNLTGEGSDIVLTAGGNIRIAAAQKENIGPYASPIDVTAANNDNGAFLRTVTREDGTVWYLPAPVEYAQSSYAQVGHGGRSSEMETEGVGHNGDITVAAGGDIEVLASDFERGIEVGAEGFPSVWEPGPITDEFGNELFYDTAIGEYTTDGSLPTARVLIPAGRGSANSQFNYAQIGHGGYDTGMGDITGDIFVSSSGGGLTLSAGNGNRNYAQIGHGGNEEDSNLLRPGTFSGDILVDVSGPIEMSAGLYSLAYSQIGHGGTNMNNTDTSNGWLLTTEGDITVVSRTGDINLTGGQFGARDVDGSGNVRQGDGRYVMIGHGGWNGDMNASGDITVEATLGDIVLNAGVGRGDFTMIGHGGFSFDTGVTGVTRTFNGDITVDAAGDIILKGGVVTTEDEFEAVLDNNGENVFPPGYAPANYPNNLASFAQIGHGGSQIGGSNGRGVELVGDITINTNLAGNDVIIRGGDGDLNHALIGHGGTRIESSPGMFGNITVNAANDVLLQGGERFMNVGLVAGGGIAYNSANFAQIGMASGADANNRTGSTMGDIVVTAGNDISLLGGGGVGAHAIIGNGGHYYGPSLENASFVDQSGNHAGNITVAAGGDLTMIGADAALADASNDVEEGDFSDRPGGFMSVAQIGNGGPGVNSISTGHTGDIDVRVGGNLTMTSGTAANAYAKIGHGDYLYDTASESGAGFRSGDIRVAVGESAVLSGAMIGHSEGSVSSALVLTGDTYVAVGRNPGSNGTLTIESRNGVESSLTSSLSGELRLYMLSHVQNLLAEGSLLNGSAYQIHDGSLLRGDEDIADEFFFTYDAEGRPQGQFTPSGAYAPNVGLGNYVVYYASEEVGNGGGNNGGGNAGGGGGGSHSNRDDESSSAGPDLGVLYSELELLVNGLAPLKYERYDKHLEFIDEKPSSWKAERGLWNPIQVGELFSVSYLHRGSSPEGGGENAYSEWLEGSLSQGANPGPKPNVTASSPAEVAAGAPAGTFVMDVVLP